MMEFKDWKFNTCATTDGLIRIIEIFDKAAEKLKYPKIKEIQISELPALTLSRYTDRSKTPGAVSVNDLSAEWLGRVTREGRFQPSRNCPDWAEKALLFFCADPQTAITNHGKLTGRC